MTEMKKHIYDENNGLWYELIGDYYIPVLTLSSEEQRPIGTDCVREYQTITDCLIFRNSFKLGARMMLEVMGDN